jgi:carnitine O-acetyltransferase
MSLMDFNFSFHFCFHTQCNNQFYYFPVLWPGTGHVAVDEGDILEILQAIERHAMEIDPSDTHKEALGVFTSLPRSEWASARKSIVDSSEANGAALNVIDSALFVLVLDNFAPETIHEAAANMLHGTSQLAAGDTAQVGTCMNRWYDKLQIIVCKNGTCGINFEHSAIDGHTALRFVSEVFAETVISFAETIVDVIHGRGRIQHVIQAVVKRAASLANNVDGAVLDVFPKKLIFDFPKTTSDRIYYAETALCDEVGACDTYVLEFRDFGKLFIVGNKLSPDSFVQMSILISYYRLYGKVVCTYEPVLTKAFFHGRTEGMRSATPQARELCRIWCDKRSTKEDKMQALRTATIEHSRLVKECGAGKGVDRHLFSLKCIAQRNGIPVPKFFESQAWKQLNHTILSTSNCGNPALRLFGFGPVVPDGFGIGYIIKDRGISYSVSSKHRQTQRYVRSLKTTLKEMESILLPLLSMKVKHQRTTLNDVKQRLARKSLASAMEEYPDIWGESSLPSPPLQESRSGSGKPFASVVERQCNVDLLNISDIQIDVNLET